MDKTVEKRVYEFPYRHTRLGGLTKVIVVCLQCRKILNPSRVQRSRSGCHGTDYYVHEHNIVAIWLEQSNSGRRTITVPNELAEIMDILHVTWLYDNSDVNDIVNVVRAYLLSKSMTSK
jgi:hypothetical protein